MFRESDFDMSILIPVMHDDKITKDELIIELNKYEKTVYTAKEIKLTKKKSPHAAEPPINHLIYTLPAFSSQILDDLRLEMAQKADGKIGFRYVVNTELRMLFSLEGEAGVDRAAHYSLARITSDTKDIPKDYRCDGSSAWAAGRIYFDKNNKISDIDTNSGGFKPSRSSAVIALAIMLLSTPQLFSDSINFIVLDKNGAYQTTHKFSIDELKVLVMKKFNDTETAHMVIQNKQSRIIHLKRDRQRVSKADKENIKPSKYQALEIDTEDSLFDSPVKKPIETSSHSLFASARITTKVSHTSDASSHRSKRLFFG